MKAKFKEWPVKNTFRVPEEELEAIHKIEPFEVTVNSYGIASIPMIDSQYVKSNLKDPHWSFPQEELIFIDDANVPTIL